MTRFVQITIWVIPVCLLASLFLTRLIIGLANRYGLVYKPSADRWSEKQTALYGGVAIFLAFIIGTASTLLLSRATPGIAVLGLLTGGVILFLFGLWDDLRPLNPVVKLLGQILAIMPFLVGIGLAYPLTTFLLTFPLIFFWMLALTNAFNLLDNMDGLCAGTATIAAGFLVGCSLLFGSAATGAYGLQIAASTLGFLVYNFRPAGPAKIFMGDCGSMFLGHMIAGLIALAFFPAPHASFLTWLDRTLLLLLLMTLPIFDTLLVIIIRKREGRSISQGGRDHSSHRLVYTGCSDKGAVLRLFGISFATGCLVLLLICLHMLWLTSLGFIAVCLIMLRLGIVLSRYHPPLTLYNGGEKRMKDEG